MRLNLDAVDWESTVWVNGTEVGTHTGGYDSFEYDISDALTGGTNEIVVGVYDPTDADGQPVGKQRLEPEAIFYPSCSRVPFPCQDGRFWPRHEGAQYTDRWAFLP